MTKWWYQSFGRSFAKSLSSHFASKLSCISLAPEISQNFMRLYLQAQYRKLSIMIKYHISRTDISCTMRTCTMVRHIVCLVRLLCYQCKYLTFQWASYYKRWSKITKYLFTCLNYRKIILNKYSYFP